jgi:hypothetical protein
MNVNSLDPEPSVSTNSTTSAYLGRAILFYSNPQIMSSDF